MCKPFGGAHGKRLFSLKRPVARNVEGGHRATCQRRGYPLEEARNRMRKQEKRGYGRGRNHKDRRMRFGMGGYVSVPSMVRSPNRAEMQM